MKYILFALVFAAFSCSHNSSSNQKSSSRFPASAGSVYFDTATFPSAPQTLLLAGAEGRRKLSATETSSAVSAYAESYELKKIQVIYADGLYQSLGINVTEAESWIKRNSKFHKGISNYVGSSDESMGDDGPSWMSINRQLREDQNMSLEEKKFLDEILYSLAQMPVASGLAFRGMSMAKADFDSIPAKGDWLQKAFTSTSLNPMVARAFGYSSGGDSQTGLLILKLKSAYSVSPLTFDHGSRGQPGRFSEYELLLPPGRTLVVHGKIEDSANKIYYVFAEEK